MKYIAFSQRKSVHTYQIYAKYFVFHIIKFVHVLLYDTEEICRRKETRHKFYSFQK